MPRLAVLALALTALLACEKHAPAPPGDIGARLTVPTADGTPYDPSALDGKPAVVVFWRPGCPHCRDELPDVLRVARDKGATAVAVQVAEPPASGQRVLDGLGWDGVTLVDDGTLRKDLAIKQVPWTLVLRPDGTAARAFVGRQSYATLASAIASAR
ncbi:MAG: TlpA family protein disulfide reductase [Kofleriaceae bacterium]|nr:TlpA family protein disulfide reductase [Kofleriaceae bacterium]MCL4226904.1 TlpA family protein disulfide reductase [Myxococcales bacterium]